MLKIQHRFKFTKESIRDRCLPPDPWEVNGNGKPVLQRVYWDTATKGFGMVVGRPRQDGSLVRSYVVQRGVNGKTVRVTIGRDDAFTLAQARRRAEVLIGDMRRGIDPNRVKREERARAKAERTKAREDKVTLAQARDWHLTALKAKKATPRTIQNYVEELDRYLSAWMERPLADIRRNDCAERHERITRLHGPYAANLAFRMFRAVYNTAAKRMEDLPRNPTIGVTFNSEERRRGPISWAELPAWRTKVDSIKNPIRRDLQMFILFTGLRRNDAKTVRWSDVRFNTGMLHRPSPKGGERRAFTVPLCQFVIQLLRKRKEDNALRFSDNCEWVFPARIPAKKSSEGRVVTPARITHVSEVKEQRNQNGKKVPLVPSPHRLRDTFATAAHEAGIPALDQKILLNHMLPTGDVTEGYQRPSEEHLRKSIEQIAEFLLRKMEQ